MFLLFMYADEHVGGACDAYTTSGEILNVELVTGDYARIGKAVGMRIITAPDVENISVGSEEFTSASGMIQTMKLNVDDVNRDALVKVWLVAFDSEITSEQSVTYTIKTYLADASAETANFDKTVSFK